VSPDSKPGATINDQAMYDELKDCLFRHARRAAIIGKENEDLPEADLPDPSVAVLVSSSKALSGRNWSGSFSGYVSKSPSSSKSSRKAKSCKLSKFSLLCFIVCVLVTPSKRSVLSPPLVTPRRLTTVTERTVESIGETNSNPQMTPRRPNSSIFSPCSDNKVPLIASPFLE